MSRFADPPQRSPQPGPTPRGLRRVLFLDDDPTRAEIFLSENPDAIWVPTVEDCLACLAEPWDEVHLDHDLGGEHFVDCGREDCGMEVVRWLCLEPRPHLMETWFFVHSHNPQAADLMVMQMHAAGFRVEARPFGVGPLPGPGGPFRPEPAAHAQARGWRAWLRDLRCYVFGSSRPR